jgi:hypothetical protein
VELTFLYVAVNVVNTYKWYIFYTLIFIICKFIIPPTPLNMKVFLSLLISLLFSCGNNGKSDTAIDDTDSIDGMTVKEWKKNYVDSLTKKITRDAIFDTVGLSLAPIKVTNAKLFREEYSSYKSINLTFKNVSSKKMDASRFAWYGENFFGEPADMGGSLTEGYGGGFTDKLIGLGRSMTLQWSILSRDGKKVILAWPTEVAFADGTKWKL